MAITVGTQLGSHEILALLGKGGMGEVYRARDTKLKRDVAINGQRGEVRGRPWWKTAIPIAITALLVAVGTHLVDRNNQTAPRLDVTQFPLVLPEDQRFTSPSRHIIAISPDGGSIVYSANNQLYLRKMTDLQARPLSGTGITGQNITEPFFSPDGRWVGFYSGGESKLKKVAVAGGAALSVYDTRGVFGAA